MKDILDQEIKIGDLIAYTTIIGRSANLGLYEVRGFTDNGKMRCHTITKSYPYGNDHDKTTLLSRGERCIILNGDSADIIKENLARRRLEIENAEGSDSYAR